MNPAPKGGLRGARYPRLSSKVAPLRYVVCQCTSLIRYCRATVVYIRNSYESYTKLKRTSRARVVRLFFPVFLRACVLRVDEGRKRATPLSQSLLAGLAWVLNIVAVPSHHQDHLQYITDTRGYCT